MLEEAQPSMEKWVSLWCRGLRIIGEMDHGKKLAWVPARGVADCPAIAARQVGGGGDLQCADRAAQIGSARECLNPHGPGLPPPQEMSSSKNREFEAMRSPKRMEVTLGKRQKKRGGRGSRTGKPGRDISRFEDIFDYFSRFHLSICRIYWEIRFLRLRIIHFWTASPSRKCSHIFPFYRAS